jgi:hypothetical protein
MRSDMKRYVKAVMFVLVLVLVATFSVSCADTKENLFSINIINGEEIHITKYHGKSNRISVPAEIKGLPVTGVTSNAFWGNNEAVSIVLPDSVEVIGNNAFFSCKSITSFNIPKSLKELGDNAFTGCDNLKSITVTVGNEYFISKDGVLFDKDMTKLIIYPARKTGKQYTVPAGITHLGRNAFCNNTYLTEIILPEGLVEIGPTAFKNCSGITKMEIPEGTESIRASAFWDCVNLESVNFPASVNNIGEQVFYGCSKLTVIYVKEGSFAHQWCEDNSRTAGMEFY